MISKLFKEALEGEKETIAVWKKGNFFEKGHWKIFEIKTGNGGGAMFALALYLLFYVFIGCLILILLPLVISLIGFQMMRSKRYIAGILASISLLYFYIDLYNEWVSSLFFYGWTNNDGEFTKGLFGESAILYFTIFNYIGIGLGLWFIIDGILISQLRKAKL
jgi:hypothetical protein